ncbi:MAG TPA: HAMP domain-containing protein [Actinomycetota bacterium]
MKRGAMTDGDPVADDRFLDELLQAINAAKAGDQTVRLPARRDGLTATVARAFNELVERNPAKEMARVISAVAEGDLTQKMALDFDGRPVEGEFKRIGTALNSMVDQLRAFSAEVTRVAREVGTEGRLGGQAEVPGVAGTWKDLTDSVNGMASNLTDQVRNIAQVTTAVASGDLSRKITVEARGEVAELKDTINTMVDQLGSFADEVTRVAREVGTEGRLGGQAYVKGVSGTWKDLTDNVNQLAANLTAQVRNIAQVTTAVASGDLSRTITVEALGEVAELKDTINTMVDRLSAFADEVTRVAREVGTEGKLGGQAYVKGVSGTWKDLTDSVNSMADNLTDQVRNIAQVTTAVASGDLSQKITVDVRGEILLLKNTINTMVDQLGSFADEVTRVAREVGTEGKLGGQAEVEGVSGTWKRLTENVNQLAANLTTQVRAIAEVATAVTEGDLTSTITVDAPGEVGQLKDNINQMIANLRETTTRNEDQDWLNSNLARIGNMLQGHRDLRTLSRLLMSDLTPLVGAQYGAFFIAGDGDNDKDKDKDRDAAEPRYKLLASYGFRHRRGVTTSFRAGEGLVGQVVVDKRPIVVEDAPTGYIRISSGLGEGAPVNIVVLPVVFEERVLAVIELASFQRFSAVRRAFLEQLVETVGVVLNTILATMRTEELLKQSQSLAEELQLQQEELRKQQDELQHTNDELQEKAMQLARQNRAIEVKNAEIELARRELEERAEQLALSSRYKSEFLANMSHELRTPLNSLMILAKLLAENQSGNLTEKQVEFAQSMYEAGNDLLKLISDILDLSKVEAGKMDISIAPVDLVTLANDIEQMFRPIAEQQALDFAVEVAPDTPDPVVTDERRVQQVLKNLLSNAFKFTEEGSVRLRIGPPPAGTRFTTPGLRAAPEVIAFSVVDSGIGIASDQLLVIFEAFQQADGTTNRRYGGTGLGLSISREIARLLGGELHVESEPARGSVFTLLLPAVAEPREAGPEDESAAEPAGDAAADPAGSGAAVAAAVAAATRRGEVAVDGPASVPGSDAARAAGLGLSAAETMLAGKCVLIVDDDVRNVYALTSVLENRGIEVLVAEDGRTGIELLKRRPAVDVVLMDIMMPVMDGYETTRAIRQLDGFRDLPIIALTAKAMRGDREKCLAAGASDYITKPVDTDQLLDMLRVWLYR